MAKGKSSDDLLDEIVTESTITCSFCKETQSLMFCDQYDAAERFFDDGWRMGTTKCYCPKCADKKLKK